MLHNADDGADGSGESGRIENLSTRAIENKISFVGDVVTASRLLTDSRVYSQRRELGGDLDNANADCEN